MARTILSFLGLGLAAVAATGATAALTGMAGPEAIAAAAALGGVAGNFTTELCKVLHRPVAERWLEGRSGIDENHHVASALPCRQRASSRAAQSARGGGRAVRCSVACRHRFRAGSGSGSVQSCIETIPGRRNEDAETKTAERAGFRLDPDLGADESVRRDAALRDAVLKALPDVFDASLAARRDRGDDLAIRNSLAQLRTAVETAVLAIGAWLDGKAIEFYERGRDRGVNAVLAVAITVFAAALEERTRDRVPLNWATSFGSQGVALMHLADRSDDAVLAETALRQIETARDVTRDGGHAAGELGWMMRAARRSNQTTMFQMAGMKRQRLGP
jgi:hypothetical protein